jgi:hypothetical protein
MWHVDGVLDMACGCVAGIGEADWSFESDEGQVRNMGTTAAARRAAL